MAIILFGTQQVVIPWRGFRCFTHYLEGTSQERKQQSSCNPLAGI